MGVVLAGGRSTRMGRDKALLRVDKKTFLQNAVETLWTLGCDPIWVSGNYPGFDCVRDADEGRGPIEGIRASLERALDERPSGLMYFLPVDMPSVKAEHLRKLEMEMKEKSVSYFEGCPLPLCMRISLELLKHAEERVQNSDRSIRAFLKEVEIDGVQVRASEYDLNVNTTEDYRHFRSIEDSAPRA